MKNTPSIQQSGNAIFIVLIGIALAAALAYAVMKSSENSGNVSDKAVIEEQISRLFSYASTISATLGQMEMMGYIQDYTDISLLEAQDAGFDTPPHMSKIFHPLGGGLDPQSRSGPVVETIQNPSIATTYRILPAAGVEGLGDDATPDVLFTARINSAEACARINTKILNDPTIPTLSSYAALFTLGTPSIISAVQCAGCVEQSRLCVSNNAGTSWGFYSALFIK